MENNDLFAALQHETPGVTLRELESYTVRKVRERTLQRRIAAGVATLAIAAVAIIMYRAETQQPRSASTEIRSYTATTSPEQHATQRAEIQPVAPVYRPAQTVMRRKPHVRKQAALTAMPNEKMIVVTAMLLQLRAPAPPGSRESIASSFSANIIQ